jgi:hypothetical protein
VCGIEGLRQVHGQHRRCLGLHREVGVHVLHKAIITLYVQLMHGLWQ